MAPSVNSPQEAEEGGEGVGEAAHLLHHLSHHPVHHLGEDIQGDASVRTGLSRMSTYNLIYRYPIYVAYEPRKSGILHHHLVHHVLEVVHGGQGYHLVTTVQRESSHLEIAA